MHEFAFWSALHTKRPPGSIDAILEKGDSTHQESENLQCFLLCLQSQLSDTHVTSDVPQQMKVDDLCYLCTIHHCVCIEQITHSQPCLAQPIVFCT